jgi:hypothetical protein
MTADIPLTERFLSFEGLEHVDTRWNMQLRVDPRQRVGREVGRFDRPYILSLMGLKGYVTILTRVEDPAVGLRCNAGLMGMAGLHKVPVPLKLERGGCCLTLNVNYHEMQVASILLQRKQFGEPRAER